MACQPKRNGGKWKVGGFVYDDNEYCGISANVWQQDAFPNFLLHTSGGFSCVYVCVCVEDIHLYREQTIALCLSNLFAGICFPRRLYAAIIVYANWHK